MKLRSILIVPADSLVEKTSFPNFMLRILRSAKRRLGSSSMVYDSEIQRYGDIPAVLGKENVFFFGKLYPHFFSKSIPPFSPYPSCHGTSFAESVCEENEAKRVISRVDAVLVSVRAGMRGKLAIEEAKRVGKTVAIIDVYDHYANYGLQDVGETELCRGFRRGKDFDIYFKNDLPLGYRSDTVLPLAPCPLRPESYSFRALPKDTDIFFSGRRRVRGQADGEELLNALAGASLKIRTVMHEKRLDFLSLREYWDFLSSARIALSSSRLAWDSFRHCETGLAPKTALLAPKPYIETVGPELKDGKNAVLYETELRNGKYHLVRADDVLEKIRYYLAHPSVLEIIAEAWTRDVLVGHTIFSRSKYIVESIEKACF